MPKPIHGLWLITDTKSARHPVEVIAEACLKAGFQGVMLREKRMRGRPLFLLASRLATLCGEHGASLVINDRADITLCIPFSGFHTGAHGLPLSAARGLLGPERVMGYSAHSAGEARNALAEGADYTALSPVFPSITKPNYVAGGLDWFRRALQSLPSRRVMALGGINRQNLPALKETGVGGAMIMGALMQTSNPWTTAEALTRAWNDPPQA